MKKVGKFICGFVKGVLMMPLVPFACALTDCGVFDE